MPPHCALVLYARVPRLGEVKTRMTPWLEPSEALELHVALLEDSVSLLRRSSHLVSAAPFVAFSEPWEPEASGAHTSLARAVAHLPHLPQRGADLGERMRNTCVDLLERGHGAVVIFGSDSPTLPPGRLRRACRELAGGADVVLGPAEDGGYYLIGLRRPLPGLFEHVPWGTPGVLAATRRALERTRIPAVFLAPWYDLDRPADLARLHRELNTPGPPVAPRTAAFVAALARSGRLPVAGSADLDHPESP